jgi:hypothetical protein
VFISGEVIITFPFISIPIGVIWARCYWLIILLFFSWTLDPAHHYRFRYPCPYPCPHRHSSGWIRDYCSRLSPFQHLALVFISGEVIITFPFISIPIGVIWARCYCEKDPCNRITSRPFLLPSSWTLDPAHHYRFRYPCPYIRLHGSFSASRAGVHIRRGHHYLSIHFDTYWGYLGPVLGRLIQPITTASAIHVHIHVHIGTHLVGFGMSCVSRRLIK